MKTDTITQQQRKAYWAYQTSIAMELKKAGVSLQQVIEILDLYPTKDTMHLVFKSILESMHLKDTTKNMTREEMQNCLEVYEKAIAESWFDIDFPSNDKKNLLSYFS